MLLCDDFFYGTNLHSRDYNDTPMGKKREVHIQLASSDIIIVPAWRHTLAMPLAIGHKLEVCYCIAIQQLSQHNLACGQCIQTGGNFTFLGLYTPTP